MTSSGSVCENGLCVAQTEQIINHEGHEEHEGNEKVENMRTVRDGSGYGRAKFFIMLLALTLGIILAGCIDKDEQDTDITKTAKTMSEKVAGDTANTENTDTGRQHMRKEPFTNSLGMKFVYIPPGTFMMGSPSDEPGRHGGKYRTYERQRKVTLTRGFLMQTTEVTQKQWETLMRSNPSRFKKDGEKRLEGKVS